MADKILIKVPLNEVSTNDEEIIGTILRRDGKVYRWVKNFSGTALVPAGCCLDVITSVAANLHKKVASPDIGPSTACLWVPAGSPITGICPSGSATGSFGWIQAKGPKKVSMMQSGAGTGQAIGGIAIATSGQPATAPWGRPNAPMLLTTPTTAQTVYMYAKRATLLSAMADTGSDTSASALVDIQCM